MFESPSTVYVSGSRASSAQLGLPRPVGSGCREGILRPPWTKHLPSFELNSPPELNPFLPFMIAPRCCFTRSFLQHGGVPDVNFSDIMNQNVRGYDSSAARVNECKHVQHFQTLLNNVYITNKCRKL